MLYIIGKGYSIRCSQKSDSEENIIFSNLGENLLQAYWKVAWDVAKGNSKFFNVTKLKVFKFDNGEEECVISKNYQEAYDYYKGIVEDDIVNFTITEVENWHDKKVRCEESEKQLDGTYWKDYTMKELANEFYKNGYTGPNTISSTVVY